MKIAHFISNFPTKERAQVYGKSLAAYNLCKELVDRGHEVHVFTISESNHEFFQNYEGINVHSYRSITGYKSEKISVKILTDPSNYEFDIIHIHSGISIPLLAGYLLAKKTSKPLVITWHGDSIRVPDQGRYCGPIAGPATIVYKYIIHSILRHAAAIISVSSKYIERSQFLKPYENKIKCVPNGISIEDFHRINPKGKTQKYLGLEGKKVVLFLGSLFPIKGPDILLRAIPTIIQKENDTIFVFAGGGDSQRYIDMARDLGIADYVRFPGYLNQNEKVAYLQATDIFVLPSRMECFPLVCLEAMASGLPIIASNVGGIPDAVQDNENGLLIPPEDHQSLSNSVLVLLNNDQLRKGLGEKGNAMAGHYSWTAIAEETAEIYQGLVSGSNDHYLKKGY
jgi:glycosyltransferase involved in cell wall biosynthesis